MDLSKDKKALEDYTKRWTLTIMLLTENHLSELIAVGEYLEDQEKFDKMWEETQFCKACVQNHFLELSGYASECETGACDPIKTWRELHNLSSEAYEFLLPLKRKGDYTREVFHKAQEFVSKLRQIRKKLTGEVISMDHITNKDHIVDNAEAKTYTKKLDRRLILIIDLEKWEMVPGGLVVNEEKARATPCHGYDLGEGKKMLWSPGVIGTLSLPEQEKFCKVGVEIEPATGPLAKRIKALRKAGVTFR